MNIVKWILSFFAAGFIFFTLAVFFNNEGKAFTPAYEEPGLTLSDMQVKITSMGHTATFRLYDSVAAKEFYDQLPLSLDLTSRVDLKVLDRHLRGEN